LPKIDEFADEAEDAREAARLVGGSRALGTRWGGGLCAHGRNKNTEQRSESGNIFSAGKFNARKAGE
jgi:hypothetical protein